MPTTSIQAITNDLTLGWLVRGMHRWGASVFIILMFLHMARVFLFGAYKYPRELNWIIGVLLLVARDARRLHRLPAAVGPDGLLGDGRRDQHQRDGAVPRPVHRAVPPGRRGDRRGHAEQVLLAAHARRPGRDHRPDRAPPVPRHAARRQLAAVVARGRGPRPRSPRRPRRTVAQDSSVRPAAGSEWRVSADRRASRAAQALQGGRRRDREAVLPARDVPRHGDEPRRRGA